MSLNGEPHQELAWDHRDEARSDDNYGWNPVDEFLGALSWNLAMKMKPPQSTLL